jgi:hypothetical protein
VRVHNVWRQNEYVEAFVLSRRLASVAAQLLNSTRVRLYQDSTFFKYPVPTYCVCVCEV